MRKQRDASKVSYYGISLSTLLISLLLMSIVQICYASIDKTESNKSTGFTGTNIFENYGNENINILNGNLALIHPNSPLFPVNGNFSYQLQRVYNSKIWALDENICDNPTTGIGLAPVFKSMSSMGAGWTFHLGRIYMIQNYEGAQAKYYYEASDGSVHRLWGPLYGDPDCDAGNVQGECYKTRDSSYIRAILKDNGTWRLWLPDGTRYKFDHRVEPIAAPYPSDPNDRDYIHFVDEGYKGWYATRIEDIWGNGIDIEYNDTHNNFVDLRHVISKITDDHGRSITVNAITEHDNDNTIPDGWRVPRGVVKSIVVPSFKNNQNAVYKFKYDIRHISTPFTDYNDVKCCSTITCPCADRPTITGFEPAGAYAGQTLWVTIRGYDFCPQSVVEAPYSDNPINVLGYQYIGPTEMRVRISIDSGNNCGNYFIRVSNPGNPPGYDEKPFSVFCMPAQCIRNCDESCPAEDSDILDVLGQESENSRTFRYDGQMRNILDVYIKDIYVEEENPDYAPYIRIYRQGGQKVFQRRLTQSDLGQHIIFYFNDEYDCKVNAWVLPEGRYYVQIAGEGKLDDIYAIVYPCSFDQGAKPYQWPDCPKKPQACRGQFPPYDEYFGGCDACLMIDECGCLADCDPGDPPAETRHYCDLQFTLSDGPGTEVWSEPIPILYLCDDMGVYHHIYGGVINHGQIPDHLRTDVYFCPQNQNCSNPNKYIWKTSFPWNRTISLWAKNETELGYYKFRIVDSSPPYDPNKPFDVSTKTNFLHLGLSLCKFHPIGSCGAPACNCIEPACAAEGCQQSQAPLFSYDPFTKGLGGVPKRVYSDSACQLDSSDLMVRGKNASDKVYREKSSEKISGLSDNHNLTSQLTDDFQFNQTVIPPVPTASDIVRFKDDPYQLTGALPISRANRLPPGDRYAVLLTSVELPENNPQLTINYDYNEYGELSSITYPTGGEINYKYGEYDYIGCIAVRKSKGDAQIDIADEVTREVIEKKVVHDGTADTWRYTRESVTNPDPNRETSTTTIEDAEGNITIYEYNYKEIDPDDDTIEYLCDADDSMVKKITYQVDDKERTEEFVYETDFENYKNNARLKSKSTTFENGEVLTLENDDWDNKGHWRKICSCDHANSICKINYKHYYPYDIPLWILNTYDFSASYENNSISCTMSVSSSRTSYDYYSIDPNNPHRTAQIQREIRYAASTGDYDNDVIIEYDYYRDNARRANKMYEAWRLRSFPDLSYNYTINYDYQYGVMSKKKYSGLNWNIFERGINLRTSLVEWEKDTAGITTNYDYDKLNRITAIEPQNESATEIDYEHNGDRNVVRVSKDDPGTNETDIVSKYIYDGLGRLSELWKNKETAGNFSNQITEYDGLGRIKSKSEWINQGDTPVPKTKYWYDPFGRTTTILTADNKTISYRYNGISETEITTHLNTNDTSITKYEYDLFGRLKSVVDGNDKLTEYSYDGLDNLIGVVQDSHVRSFIYNPLGNLISSNNPENGVIEFQRYDSRGNLRQKTDANGKTFYYSYDSAERLTT